MKLKENTSGIKIGKIIKKKLKESGISITEFASDIGKTRTDINYIFTLEESIHIDILIAISKALNYDFIHNVYYEDYKEEKIHITVKINENERMEIDLPKELIRIIKAEK